MLIRRANCSCSPGLRFTLSDANDDAGNDCVVYLRYSGFERQTGQVSHKQLANTAVSPFGNIIRERAGFLTAIAVPEPQENPNRMDWHVETLVPPSDYNTCFQYA
jgi:hypothetical protein